MRLAILFWFYKEPEICENRLQILRQHNPSTPIYGLYGGDLADIDTYKSILTPYLDDFYAFSEEKDSYWKWIQGDLMITQWYRDRGKDLNWDTIVIVQWDMLVFGAIEDLFSMLKPDQILLSGLRPIHEVEADWSWVSPKVPDRRQQYLKFLDYVNHRYDYQEQPLGCLFIVVGFPRKFLEQYSYIEQPELGFLEYRIPIYAQIFGIPFCTNHPFSAWWVDCDPIFSVKNPLKRAFNSIYLRLNPNPLNPAKREISLIPIQRHLQNPNGAHIFHPYEKVYPQRKQEWWIALFKEFQENTTWFNQKLAGKL